MASRVLRSLALSGLCTSSTRNNSGQQGYSLLSNLCPASRQALVRSRRSSGRNRPKAFLNKQCHGHTKEHSHRGDRKDNLFRSSRRSMDPTVLRPRTVIRSDRQRSPGFLKSHVIQKTKKRHSLGLWLSPERSSP